MPTERTPLLNGQSQHQANNPFPFEPSQLCDLVDPKSPDSLKKLGNVDGLAKGLKVDLSTGLLKDESIQGYDSGSCARQEVYGKNVMPETEQRSLLSLIWEAYQDHTLILLSIASLVSLAVGLYEDSQKDPNGDEPRVGWVEGAAIIVAVLVVVLTNAVNDYQKEKQFRKLNAKKDDRLVKVVRDGREEEISVFELVVGDVLCMEPGDICPVDGVYISGHHLVCDESSATGESDAIKKGTLDQELDPFILSGSKVQEGVGRALVIAVGVNSFSGKTMMAMRDGGDEETPLQLKLDSLAESIAKLGMAAAILMLITLSLKYWITAAINKDIPDFAHGFSAMVQIVIQAITIVVVAVPEGLPMAVTLALAYATTQMIKDNNLVRVLAACETMGNATVICSDKTGTLTQNKMTVVQAVVSEKSLEGCQGLSEFKQKLPEQVLITLNEAIACNSSAFEGKDEDGNFTFIGSKTEVALLTFLKGMGEDYNQIRKHRKQARVYPFASKVKSMTTIVETPDSNSEYRVYSKGASEIILGACTHYLDGDGETKPLSKEAKENFKLTIHGFAVEALRTISLAFREVSQSDLDSFSEEEAPLEKLVMIGIVGIEDPLRDGVKDSVTKCRDAGVYVKMITGDNLETAKAIATKAGIYSKGGTVMTGPELRKLNESQLAETVPRLQVLARSSPSDKQIVVRTLQKLGDVVAMTGDGTNDGPALKMADVGFSMGIAGTEVAKEASAIILMDDNFNSIVKAMKWGRAVNQGVRKFLQFQLTVNITAVILAFISALTNSNNESILTSVQLLWVNLIMDTLAALALATEPPTDELLESLPTDRKAPLITNKMWKHIFGQAIFQICINLAFIYFGDKLLQIDIGSPDGEAVLRTCVFNAFVFLQVFNELNCRRINDEVNVLQNITHNQIFVLVQVVVVVGQIILVLFGGAAFSTVPLTAYQWFISILIGSLSLPVGLVLRLLPDFSSDEGQYRTPLVSREQMIWESVGRDVQRKNKVFSALRRSRKSMSSHSRSFSTDKQNQNTTNNA
ncbi:PMCA-type calcium-translocating P-type ATPase [Neoconidiobolus thromboides FSU 785]|nr:PMCA-type calcium-translocating P-type ATPase [Neoconidiobolus thromboides FSU 785]